MAHDDASPDSTNLKIWNILQRIPFGNQVFTQALCIKAPYFRTIHPTLQELRPGYCRVTAPNRRGVHNHLGTFHAIASCNMAELAAGMMTDATVPPTHRWIPVGMTVEYRAQARTAVTSTATLTHIPRFAQEPMDLVVPVDITDEPGTVVVAARITMRISPRRS